MATIVTTGRGIGYRLGRVARGLLALPARAHHDDPAITTTGPIATYRVGPGSYTLVVSDTAGAVLCTMVEVVY